MKHQSNSPETLNLALPRNPEGQQGRGLVSAIDLFTRLAENHGFDTEPMDTLPLEFDNIMMKSSPPSEAFRMRG